MSGDGCSGVERERYTEIEPKNAHTEIEIKAAQNFDVGRREQRVISRTENPQRASSKGLS